MMTEEGICMAETTARVDSRMMGRTEQPPATAENAEDSEAELARRSRCR